MRMKCIDSRDVMKNQEVAWIIDFWNDSRDYVLFLHDGLFYRLNLDNPYEDLPCFNAVGLAEDLISFLEERQPVHRIESFKEEERKQIELLKAFVEQEKTQPTESY